MPEPLISLAPGIDTWSLAAVRSSDGSAFTLKLSVVRGEESSTLTLAASRDEARDLAFGILATVGDATLRTFEPGLLKQVARETVAAPIAQPAPDRDAARAQGFTGDVCDGCGAAKMLRTGHCLTCQNCSANTGCS